MQQEEKMVATMIKRIYWAFMTAWLSLTLYLLNISIADGHLFTDAEFYTMHFLKISALNFPSGPIVLSLGEVCVLSFETFSDLSNSISISQKAIISWFVMSFFGFIQWFFLLPLIFRKIQHRQLNRLKN